MKFKIRLRLAPVSTALLAGLLLAGCVVYPGRYGYGYGGGYGYYGPPVGIVVGGW